MDNRDGSKGSYRWTCPFCGPARINRPGGERGKENAIVALRTHIIASDGDSHGPRNEFPSNATVTLSDHVSAVADRQ